MEVREGLPNDGSMYFASDAPAERNSSRFPQWDCIVVESVRKNIVSMDISGRQRWQHRRSITTGIIALLPQRQPPRQRSILPKNPNNATDLHSELILDRTLPVPRYQNLAAMIAGIAVTVCISYGGCINGMFTVGCWETSRLHISPSGNLLLSPELGLYFVSVFVQDSTLTVFQPWRDFRY
jgi:hypothetical protein